jgi:hypothetical protein
MKKEMPENIPEFIKNINSLKLRTNYILSENAQIEQAFSSREAFWDNEKEKFDKIIVSLNGDREGISKDFSGNVLFTERIITDFRNKVKSDRIDALKKNIESWNVNEFVTKKRFSELLSMEINSFKKI